MPWFTRPTNPYKEKGSQQIMETENGEIEPHTESAAEGQHVLSPKHMKLFITKKCGD